MKRLIDKDALVAEIKERIKTYNKGYANGDDSRADALEVLLHDIDTLEVKEGDLQSEIDRVWDNTSDAFLEDGWKEFEDIAKRFFELGLNASNPLTWEDMRELYIIFAEVDTEIELCKTDIKSETIGYYEEVLKRFLKERKEK